MMKGELTINGLDAWENWGIMLDGTSLSSLMTPASVKDYPTNKSRLENGTRYLVDGNVKTDERDISIKFQIVADTKEKFYKNYESFCEQLKTGRINISTKYQSGVVYKTLYRSCTQYQQYLGKVGKFTLRLTEPNPEDRTAE